jgi:hypothetical protein
MVRLNSKDGNWTGTAVKDPALGQIPDPAIDKIAVADGKLTFTLKLKTETLPFEIRLPKDAGDKLYGTVLMGQNAEPVMLEKTTLKSLDTFEVNKEIVAKSSNPVEVVMAGLDLLQEAKTNKAKKEDVKAWTEKAVQSANLYGPRYARVTTLRAIELLGGDEEYADVGVEYARRAEKQLTPKDRPQAQKRVLELLATALEKAGKKDEAKEVNERIKKIDTTLKPEPFAGRKAKSDRVVLVELFTGAQCGPCVAADMAFDGMLQTYKPKDVVLLEYHLHIPRPDPMANEDTDARSTYYGEVIGGTPTILFNGAPDAPGGGTKEQAVDKYGDYVDVIDPLLEEPAKLKLTASARQKGNKIDINAEVTADAKPGDKVRLRLVLVEDKVEYTGSNKIAEHHHVVRQFPGGTEGVVVRETSAKAAATVDLDELKKSLKDAWLKTVEKEKLVIKDQPLELKKLKVVAFVQNDTTKEILQAVQVDVKASE